MRRPGQRRKIGVRRRRVHVDQRLAQRRQLMRCAQRGRNQLQLRVRRQLLQRAPDHAAETLRTEAFGGRIDRRQAFLDLGRSVIGNALVLRVHHLHAVLAVAHVAETTQACADRQLIDLRVVEMEEAQDQRAV